MPFRNFLFFLSILMAAYACKKNTSSNISKESGTIQNDPDTPKSPTTTGSLVISGQLEADSKADTAAVFDVSNTGFGNAATIAEVKVTAGTLAIPLDKATLRLLAEENTESSQVIAVFAKGETPLDSFDSIDFITLPTSSDETLTNLATSKLKEDKLELGSIEKNGEDLVAAKEITSADIEMNEEAINEIAATDDAVRLLKNFYANNDAKSGKYMRMALGFFWKYDARNAINAALDPASIIYTGWGPELQSNREELQLDVLCLNTSSRKNMKIVVPGEGVSSNPSDPAKTITEFTNANAKENAIPATTDRRDCSTTNGYIAQGNGTDQMFMNFGGGDTFMSPIPKGIWTVTVDDKLIGKFDLAVANPIDPTDGHTKVYIPSVQVTVDTTTNKISKAELYIYLWDKKKGSYEKVTDYDAMKQAVQYVTLGLGMNPNGEMSEGISLPSGETPNFPENGKPWVLDVASSGEDWRMNANWIAGCPKPTEGFKRVDTIGVDIGMYTNRYKFFIKMPGMDSGPCP